MYPADRTEFVDALLGGLYFRQLVLTGTSAPLGNRMVWKR